MSDSNKTILKCKSGPFYTLKDEDAFFEWIKKIECIEDVKGVGRELYFYIACDDLHDRDLIDLIGLFYRYKKDMKQLARFLTPENKSWFYDKKAYWYKKIFGS